GARPTVLDGRVSPKRWFTSYMKRWFTGSKPRTYRSVWSPTLFWPHPRRPLRPWRSSSSTGRGFASESDTDVLAGSPKLPGTMATPIPIVAVHGPEQLLRPARVPSWLVRQEPARPVALSSRGGGALASDMC